MKTLVLSFCLFFIYNFAVCQVVTVKEQNYFEQPVLEIVAKITTNQESIILDFPGEWILCKIHWGYFSGTVAPDEEIPLLPFMQSGTVFAQIFPAFENENCEMEVRMLPILVKIKIETIKENNEDLTQIQKTN